MENEKQKFETCNPFPVWKTTPLVPQEPLGDELPSPFPQVEPSSPQENGDGDGVDPKKLWLWHPR